MDANKTVIIVYTNYKGVTGKRRIVPIEILFGHNEWHTQDQWLMRALDLEKNAERTFALKDIQSWCSDASTD